jgi:chemotaxis protein MotB
MAKKKPPKEPRKGAPAYMVSFGDMMTLILCFFILLVSMATEQNYGLLAKGVGSFIVAIESHGLNGIMSAHEKEQIFENVRRRFNLPPEADPERREDPIEASQFELLKAEALEALTPHRELRQPRVATFEPGSAALTAESRSYLDRLADSLKPNRGQILLIEGHALDADAAFGTNQWLAFRRAAEVRKYLIDEHGFNPRRVEARAWLEDIVSEGVATRTVDARLVTPKRK